MSVSQGFNSIFEDVPFIIISAETDLGLLNSVDVMVLVPELGHRMSHLGLQEQGVLVVFVRDLLLNHDLKI